MFDPQLSWKSISQVSRAMGTMLHSGVGVQKAVQLASQKTSDPRAHRVLEAVSKDVANGSEVAEAMRKQQRAFPGLMLDMVEVGEKTGALPEVLESLANHYENNLRLRRSFYLSIAWPMFQLIAAILVIALVIWILGWIMPPESREFDILGLGYGTAAAMTWLFSTFGTMAAIVVGYQIFKRTVAAQKFLHPLLLQIPLIGHCMRSFAIARFSWAFALTQQAGMNIEESLTASLRATSNGAFIAATRPMWNSIEEGETLSHAMAETRLFPTDYMHMVEVAEHSGTVPEMLDRLSPKFEDQARRALDAMAAMLGWGVWMLVATFIIFLIFRIVLNYVGLLQSFTKEALK